MRRLDRNYVLLFETKSIKTQLCDDKISEILGQYGDFGLNLLFLLFESCCCLKVDE